MFIVQLTHCDCASYCILQIPVGYFGLLGGQLAFLPRWEVLQLDEFVGWFIRLLVSSSSKIPVG